MTITYIETNQIRKTIPKELLKLILAMSKDGIDLRVLAGIIDSGTYSPVSKSCSDSLKAYKNAVKAYKKKTHISIDITLNVSRSISKNYYSSNGYKLVDVILNKEIPKDIFIEPVWRARPELSQNQKKHGFTMVEY